MAEKAMEIITGQPHVNEFVTDAMKWGTEHEHEARERFIEEEFLSVEEVGFVPHPTIKGSGASPDGLVEGGSILEIKCPTTARHFERLMQKQVPTEYITQIHWQAACTRRFEDAHYVDFDPRCPRGLDYLHIRCPIDVRLVETLELEVVKFKVELDALVEELRRLLNAKA